MKLLSAFLIIATVLVASPGLPEKIAIAEFKEESYFRSFGQYLQKEDGEFTREFGRVLIVKNGESFELAFYRKEAAAYVRLGSIVEFRDTRSPFASAMNEPAVPCISARKKDGSGRLNAYVLRGKVVVSESKE